MSLLRGLQAAAAYAFWSFVVWEAGPRHDCYGYARFAQWQARASLKQYLGR